jgi:hypothetical protein
MARFHRGRRDDESCPGDQDAMAPGSDAREADLQTGHHEADHQSVVVRSADDVEEHERVGRTPPQRPVGVGAHTSRQTGQRPHDHREPGERDDSVSEHTEQDVLVGQLGDRPTDHEEQWTVGGRGVAPEVGDAADQRVVDAQRQGGPEPVGVEAPGEYRALGEVAVHVAGEQGRGEQQRRGPGRRGARELGTRGRSPSPPLQRDARPRQHDERDAGVGDGEGDRRVARG